MKNLISIFIILIFWQKNLAQETHFQIDDISENYAANIYIEDSLSFYNHKPSKADITIYEKYIEKNAHGRKQKIRISDAELDTGGLFGDAYPVVSTSSSNWKGWIIYDDFNFDGNWDFAIQYKVRKECKDPYYKIYLSDGKDFYYSNSFTKLATEQCETFKIDRINKKLITNQSIKDNNSRGDINNKYIMKNGEPVLIESIESKRKFNNNMVVYVTTKKIQGDKIVVTNTTENMLDAEGVVNFFSFETESGKKANIYFEASLSNNDLSGYIGYMLLDSKGNVEFSYPILEKTKNDFIYNKTLNTLIFKNENTEYIIYEDDKNIGVKIKTNGKIYNWTGESKTKKGILSKIIDFKIKNITILD